MRAVINMIVMFSNVHAFNQPIGSWDVSKATDMGCGHGTPPSLFQSPRCLQ
ncbi:BspA family leucine-rich repeat surface protein [archaeon]|nr:MAG: BspA family leucine-rich repeat surface protein [archaeon]